MILPQRGFQILKFEMFEDVFECFSTCFDAEHLHGCALHFDPEGVPSRL